MSLPAEYRRKAEGTRFVLLQWEPTHLTLFPPDVWATVSERLLELRRGNRKLANVLRDTMSRAIEVEPDHTIGRRKIVDQFFIDYGRCMRCNICVEVCNFEAIGMNNTWAGHELSRYDRKDLVMDLDMLMAQSKAGKVDPGLRA